MTKSKSRKSAAPATKPAAKAPSKADTLIALLRRDSGASLEEMMQASGWQKHSVRGFMAGALKKKGFTVTSARTDGARSYRIAGEAQS